MGLKYDSCCWSISFNLGGSSHARQREHGPDVPERSLGIQFEMKGLGSSVGTPAPRARPWTPGQALPYIRPFNLRDQ